MSRIYISQNARKELIDYLKGKGHDVVPVMPAAPVHPAVAAHPDIYMCKLGTEPEAPVFHGNPGCLTAAYPGDIIYNAVCMGRYFIHKLSCTSSELLAHAEWVISEKYAKHAESIDVPQGYTKCNMVVVDERSAVTSDEGIARALHGDGTSDECDIDVLLISKGYVTLSGFDYGFLGGASGRVGEEIIFNGDLSKHPDFEKIRDFILSRGLKIKYFDNYELEDIGSIIEEPDIL